MFGQTGLGKQCRSRTEEQSDQGLHCLPVCYSILHHLEIAIHDGNSCKLRNFTVVSLKITH